MGHLSILRGNAGPKRPRNGLNEAQNRGVTRSTYTGAESWVPGWGVLVGGGTQVTHHGEWPPVRVVCVLGVTPPRLA